MEFMWCKTRPHGYRTGFEDHLERRWCTRHSVCLELRESRGKAEKPEHAPRICDAVPLQMQRADLLLVRVCATRSVLAFHSVFAAKLKIIFICFVSCLRSSPAIKTHTPDTSIEMHLKCYLLKSIFRLLRVIQKWLFYSFDWQKP